MKTPVSVPLLAAALATAVSAASPYRLVDLGTPATAASGIDARINNRGTLALTAQLPASPEQPDEARPAAYVRRHDSFVALPNPRAAADSGIGTVATALNDHDEVAGHFYQTPDAVGAFVYDAATHVLQPITAPGIATQFTNGLTNSGKLLGAEFSGNDSSWVHDLRTGTTVRLSDTSPHGLVTTYGINNDEWVLGEASDYPHAAFLHRLGTDVFQPAPHAGRSLNDTRSFVQRSLQPEIRIHRADGSIHTIALPGPTGAGPVGINDWEHLAGSYTSHAGPRAWLWDGVEARDLNAVVPAGARDGWTLETATAVNDFGQVVGTMRHLDGRLHLFRLDPAAGAPWTVDQTWRGHPLPAQSGPFTVHYIVVPFHDRVDLVTGLASGDPDWFTDLAAIVRFAPTGQVDARNGGRFAAAHTLSYRPGLAYRVTLEVDVAAGRYSATVQPAGAAPVVIANNYTFRDEQSGVSSLNRLGTFAVTGAGAVGGVELETSPGDEIVSADTWENVALPPSTGRLAVNLRATPSRAPLDGVVALGRGAADWWTDLAAIVRFAPTGFVDARNGGRYAAASTFAYQAGVAYEIAFSVDVAAGRYSATIAAPGAAPVPIAHDYLFRSEQQGISSIDTLTVFAQSGALAVRDLTAQNDDPPAAPAGATSNGQWAALPFTEQTGTFVVSYDATPSAAPGNASTGLSAGPAGSFNDFATMIRFAPSGSIDARNSGLFMAVNPLTYTAGTTYHVRMTVNVSTRRYSATVAPAGGAPVVIAKNYAFRNSQRGATRLDHVSLIAGTGSVAVGNVRLE